MTENEDKTPSKPPEQPADESSSDKLTNEELSKVSGGASRCGKCGNPLELCVCKDMF